ncbi:molybdopterin synthase sulfur carrier subunit [Sphingorhabdus sp. IMCC26285]|uniref:Molybdopterin synthase sulfur carrier subunit n=1 Tax=Sphingorhabdus profundilacus TaxID=2509718 RepID=A0A6I4LXX0_9SPHN|nr:MoaD/ThiS family protein [Sphingorhabdus profundilacus]MVZ97729.1 molybdopterin synthase sulfur carrier subunit [Sphingorhabdus profundilacus]
MRFVYFARVREAVGMDCEERDVPVTVHTVQDCLDWLRQCDGRYAAAFAEPARLRYALDQQMVTADTPLDGYGELAIFPPVTGG